MEIFLQGAHFSQSKIFQMKNIVRYDRIHKETHIEIIEIKIPILETKCKNMQKKVQ